MKTVLFFLVCLLLAIVHSGNSLRPSESTVYVIGAGKDVAKYVPFVKQNILSLSSFFKTMKVFVYSDELSRGQLGRQRPKR